MAIRWSCKWWRVVSRTLSKESCKQKNLETGFVTVAWIVIARFEVLDPHLCFLRCQVKNTALFAATKTVFLETQGAKNKIVEVVLPANLTKLNSWSHHSLRPQIHIGDERQRLYLPCLEPPYESPYWKRIRSEREPWLTPQCEEWECTKGEAIAQFHLW